MWDLQLTETENHICMVAVDRAVASISLGDSLEGELTDDSLESEDYELLSDEDLEEIIQKYV